MQPRIMAAVRSRGTTIAGLGRESLAGLAIRHQQAGAGTRRSDLLRNETRTDEQQVDGMVR